MGANIWKEQTHVSVKVVRGIGILELELELEPYRGRRAWLSGMLCCAYDRFNPLVGFERKSEDLRILTIVLTRILSLQ